MSLEEKIDKNHFAAACGNYYGWKWAMGEGSWP